MSVDRGIRAVIEMIGQGELAGGAGVGRQRGVSLADHHRAFELEHLAHPVLFDECRLARTPRRRRGSSRRSPGIRVRRSRHAVVDAHAGQSGHDVLGHLDGGVALSDRRAARSGDDPIDPCGHPRTIGQVDPLEHDARAGLGRPEAKRDVGPVEEPMPTHFSGVGKRALPALGFQHSLPLINATRKRRDQFWSGRAPCCWPAGPSGGGLRPHVSARARGWRSRPCIGD